MGQGRVCVVEDEPVIRQAICQMLRLAGYEVVEAADGEEGLRAAQGPGIELVLLDLMLPKRDGLSVLEELRKLRPGLPVIVLTAKGSEEDVVRGLKHGADDYVVKPFGARELMARIEAVQRRTPQRPSVPEALSLGAWRVDFERGEARGPDGACERLTSTEEQILGCLAAERGHVVSREALLTALWGQAGGRAESRTVDMHVAKLRAKLGDASKGPSLSPPGDAGPKLIQTVRGKGYRLASEDEL